MNLFRYSAKIVKIVDGDTVDVDIDLGFSVILANQRLRLYGIDTPEVRTRDLLEKEAGNLAKARVEELLVIGESYPIWTVEKGKFGRYLAKIWPSFEEFPHISSVNAMLIQEDLAVEYYGQSKKTLAAERKKQYTRLRKKGYLKRKSRGK
tara:strand:+ start:362 stop:811 length:450 start_codon:yes stop_codon:yes gene_type:complete